MRTSVALSSRRLPRKAGKTERLGGRGGRGMIIASNWPTSDQSRTARSIIEQEAPYCIDAMHHTDLHGRSKTTISCTKLGLENFSRLHLHQRFLPRISLRGLHGHQHRRVFSTVCAVVATHFQPRCQTTLRRHDYATGTRSPLEQPTCLPLWSWFVLLPLASILILNPSEKISNMPSCHSQEQWKRQWSKFLEKKEIGIW